MYSPCNSMRRTGIGNGMFCFFASTLCCLRLCLSLNPEFTDSATQAGQRASELHQPPPTHCLDYGCAPPYLAFMWMLEI